MPGPEPGRQEVRGAETIRESKSKEQEQDCGAGASGWQRWGECVWGCGAVTPLQVLKTLGDLEVAAVTKPLQSRYRALQNQGRELNRRDGGSRALAGRMSSPRPPCWVKAGGIFTFAADGCR